MRQRALAELSLVIRNDERATHTHMRMLERQTPDESKHGSVASLSAAAFDSSMRVSHVLFKTAFPEHLRPQ